ncbi:hypothetical protein [Pseudomonas sp. NGC7]|uniref:hypothetical protein n=1 Tax=Pseudomonas sp. NGC7 TaxID=3341775 RepID=UPI0037DAA1E5
MTIWIILFWIIGVGLIIGVAIYRGIKNGPTKFPVSPIEEMQRAQAQASAESASASIREMRADIERLNRKIEALHRDLGDVASKKAESTVGQLTAEQIREIQERFTYPPEVDSVLHTHKPYASFSAAGPWAEVAMAGLISHSELVHSTSFQYHERSDSERKSDDEPIVRIARE